MAVLHEAFRTFSGGLLFGFGFGLGFMLSVAWCAGQMIRGFLRAWREENRP